MKLFDISITDVNVIFTIFGIKISLGNLYIGYDDRRLIARITLKKKSKSKPFVFEGNKLELFEHEYNCGFKNQRMSERSIEIAIFKEWIKDKENIFEVGAVSPYYFPNLIKDICDPADEHELVTNRCSLFDLDFTGRNVVCISTLEHIGTFEYNLKLVENPEKALEKLIKESKNLLVTFPAGYNHILDDYISEGQYKNISLKENEKLEVYIYKRGITNNFWKKVSADKAKEIPYTKCLGTMGLVVVNKKVTE